jgi:hypothetical protein
MRNNLITLFLILVAGYSAAQNTTFSPWSSQGIGDRSYSDHGMFSGMGNCRVSYFDSTVLNFYNPSSYNNLSKGMPLYSIGLNARFTQLNDAQKQNWNFTLVPDHFAMGFGLKKYVGFAFGLKPFTRSGYEITQRTKIGTDSIKYVYKGKGGSEELFVGLSTDLINLRSTRLSIGGNAGYIFGTAQKERQSLLINGNTIVGGVDWNNLKLNAFHYEFAANLKQNLGKKHAVVLTAVVEPKQNLNATASNYLFYGNVEDPEFMDTLSATTNVKTTISLAGKTQLGFAWKIQFKDARKDNSLRNSELAFHVNHTQSIEIRDTTISYVVNQNSGWNFGIQYTPEIGFQENTTNMKFLEKLHYRAGYYQQYLPYIQQEHTVMDKGFSVGFGMPVTSFRTLSSLNFAFYAGERSNFQGSEYRERYLGFSFGVTLAPSNFDKWFVKRKLD